MYKITQGDSWAEHHSKPMSAVHEWRANLYDECFRVLSGDSRKRSRELHGQLHSVCMEVIMKEGRPTRPGLTRRDGRIASSGASILDVAILKEMSYPDSP